MTRVQSLTQVVPTLPRILVTDSMSGVVHSKYISQRFADEPLVPLDILRLSTEICKLYRNNIKSVVTVSLMTCE